MSSAEPPDSVSVHGAGRPQLYQENLRSTLRFIFTVGWTCLQPLFFVGAVLSETRAPLSVYAAVCGAAFALGLAALLLRLRAILLDIAFFGSIGFLLAALVQPDGPMLSLLITVLSWACGQPVLLVTSKRGIVWSAVIALGFSILIVCVHPDWPMSVAYGALLRCAVTIAAAGILMVTLLRFMADIDARRTQEIQQRIRAARARTISTTTAEYVRILHDTIVNTFAVLSRASSVRFDPRVVQDRCRRDLRRIHGFQRRNVGELGTHHFEDLSLGGLPVRFPGCTADDLRRFESLLAPDVLAALHDCALEAVRNAAKHSGADHVRGSIRAADGGIALELEDAGVGFDPAAIHERGLRSSMRERAQEHGISVSVHSAIGEGTRIRFVCPASSSVPARAASPSASQTTGLTHAKLNLRAFKLRTGITWCAFSLGMGVVPAVLAPNPGSVLQLVTLLAMAALCVVGFALRLRAREMPVLLACAVIAAVPAANWALLSAAGFGTELAYMFPTTSITVLHVLLHVTRRRGRWFGASVVVNAVSSIVIAVIAADHWYHAGFAVLMLTTPVLVHVMAWYLLQLRVRSVGRQAVRIERDAAAAALQAAIDEADLNVRMRWSTSALQELMELLQQIADGALTVSDPQTRQRCAQEESYLRQVSSLLAETSLLNWWFALALAEARTGGVRLNIELEHTQVTELDLSDALGRLLLSVIANVPADSELTVSLLQHRDAPHMFIVAAADSAPAAADLRSTADLVIEFQRLADQVLIEAYPR